MDVALMISLWHIWCIKPIIHTINCQKYPQSLGLRIFLAIYGVKYPDFLTQPLVITSSIWFLISTYNCLGTHPYSSLTGTLSVNSISISKSLMSPMSLTFQENASFRQFNISVTILCLVTHKLLKSKFGVQSKFSGLSGFFHVYIGLSNMQGLSFTF